MTTMTRIITMTRMTRMTRMTTMTTTTFKKKKKLTFHMPSLKKECLRERRRKVNISIFQ
jgi:hypothetical protein